MGDILNIGVHVLLFLVLYFEVFLLITFFEHYSAKDMQTRRLPSRRLPTVSIIVPCYNEERTVGATLRSLLDLNYPKKKLDIIVVDDGSTDNTWRILQRFKRNPRITLLRKDNGGKHTALNLGLPYANTDLVGCLDSDSFVHKEALNEMVQCFKDGSIMAVTPAIKVHGPRNIVELIQKAEYNLAIFIRRTFAFLDAIFITPGPFSIFRRSVFNEIGMYRQGHNTEDMEFALRMQSRGLRIGNAHAAIVYTNAPATIRSLIRQRVRWTYGFIKNIFDYRSVLFNRGNGHLGMLVLPTTLTFLFGSLYFVALFLGSLTARVLDKALEVEAIGLSSFVPSLSFDWFLVSTDSVIFLTMILLIAALALIMLGKRISQEERMWSRDIVYYLLFYGFLAPLWLVKALFHAMLGRQTSWAAERSSNPR